MEKVDIAVIGAGPAGLTASIYAARAQLNTIVFDKGLPGGQILNTTHVENYPGFPEGISGPALSEAMEKQALNSGARIAHLTEVQSMELSDEAKVIHSSEGSYEAGAVILASGASPNKLGVPGEEEYSGRGVSYCATCDGAFFKGKRVAVVGGGDTALEDALYLSRIADKVTVIHRRDKLRAQKYLQTRAFNTPNIDFVWNSRIQEVLGNEVSVESLVLVDAAGNPAGSLPVDGLFIAVGLSPNSVFFPDNLATEDGYVLSDDALCTNIKGVFVAGDVRKNALKQISVAVGEAALAATGAVMYIDEIGWRS